MTRKKVNVDFPAWVVEDLDKEADRLGVERQSLIKPGVNCESLRLALVGGIDLFLQRRK